MVLSVILCGAKGRMGQQVLSAIEQSNELECVAALCREDSLLEACSSIPADVGIDFTQAGLGYEHAKVMLSQGINVLIGTSGVTPEELQLLDEQAKKAGLRGLLVPNFSIGMVLLMESAKHFASYFPQVSIIEQHQLHKKEAPSATAQATARAIANARGEHSPWKGQINVPGVLGGAYEGVQVHALRQPGPVAQETIIFGGQGEQIQLQHTTLERSAFMPGVLLACQKLKELPVGFHEGLEKVL